MIFPTPMKQLIAVVLEHDSDAVTKVLLEEGVMHFVGIRELAGTDAEQLKNVEQISPHGEISETRRRIESLLKMAGILIDESAYLDIAKLSPIDLEKTGASLDTLAATIQNMHTRQSEAQQEILKLRDIQRQVELYGDLGRGIKSTSQFSYLDMQTGTVPKSGATAFSTTLKEFPSVLIELRSDEQEVVYFLITMKRDERQIGPILDKYEWRDVEIGRDLEGVSDDVLGDLEGKIAALRKTQDELSTKITDTISEKTESLKAMWGNLRMNELYSRIQSYFSHTQRTVLFTGWLPSSKQPNLDKRIRETSTNQCYLEWREPPNFSSKASQKETGADDAPVELRNPNFLRPFQMLVQNFSIPEYGTIDPTPLVAVAYLAMFGLMFGDVGHGLVIMLSGLLGLRLYKKQNNVRHILSLLVWCGAASIVTGVLFGAYFGTQLFKPLWFDYSGIVSGHGEGGLVNNIYDVLVITVYFGISVIALGLVLNWTNLVNKRRWFDLIFLKEGLLGGVIYGFGVWAAIYFVQHDYKELPGGTLLFIFIGIPVIILGFKGPLEQALHKGEKRQLNVLSFIDFFMEWIVEILEIFTGYLANTLSFMRVAGLGIAHEALMIAFFQIAHMISGEGQFSIWSILVLIAGNAMVIVLEGLSAGIQSLRLNYYEFFSKYFSGTGKAYNPVSLRSRD